VQIVEKAMGTRVVLAGYTTEALDRTAVQKTLGDALGEIRRIEHLMTTWRKDSEVSRINAEAGKAPVKVSQETFDVIAKSLWIAKLSEGTFDITFASMGDVWSFDENVKTEIPDPEVIEEARKKIDYRKVKLDPEALTVELTDPDTRINLGGIAKGYAIDKAAAILRKRGVHSFYAQAGGDLYVEGRKPNGQPWRVGVRDPRGPEDAFFALIGVENHAFSTAGDYERAFIKNGKRYHHIIDPRTGYPATASRSVTIWAKDAFTADAIDDAVFILGVEKGLALVEKLDDTGAVIVDADNKVHVSPRLRGVIQMLREPSEGP
jgi:thiamine biosynthesis lipoprotein